MDPCRLDHLLTDHPPFWGQVPLQCHPTAIDRSFRLSSSPGRACAFGNLLLSMMHRNYPNFRESSQSQIMLDQAHHNPVRLSRTLLPRQRHTKSVRRCRDFLLVVINRASNQPAGYPSQNKCDFTLDIEQWNREPVHDRDYRTDKIPTCTDC